jgi:hypothetical protein
MARADQLVGYVRSDEAGAAGNQDVHARPKCKRSATPSRAAMRWHEKGTYLCGMNRFARAASIRE